MRIVIHPEYKDIAKFIDNLPETFQTSGKILYEGRNIVKLYEINNLSLVVKRYKDPNIFQRIAYTFFKKSKAERAYFFAKKFRDDKINTPHEVAYIENKKRFLLKETFFISLNSTLPSLYNILNIDDFNKDIAGKLAHFLISLHEKGILHGDLNLSNILYEKDDDNNYSFTLIDTNRTIFKNVVTIDDALENMVRLTHNKKLLNYIVTEYSNKRGWDPQMCCNFVMYKLHRFEKRRELKYSIKDFLGLKKKK